MNEIARINENGELAQQHLPQTTAVIQLQEWASELAAAHQLGSALAQSSFLPMSLRKKGKDSYKNIEELTNDAAAVILAGKSVGLDPMQSVQNIFPVHGMPSMYARTMGALVIAQGHEVERAEATDESVTYRARRKGADRWQEFTWTIERARKAKYTGNDKYLTDPIAMLGAKAQAEACRVVFPDVLLGMAYSVEELELDDMGETVNTPPAEAEPKPKRTVKRKSAPAPDLPAAVNDAPKDEEPEPEADKETGEVKDEPTEPASTMAQQRKIAILLDNDGYTERADKLDVLSAWTDRAITTSKDLTKDEASKFIDEFESNDKDGGEKPADEADQAWLKGAGS